MGHCAHTRQQNRGKRLMVKNIVVLAVPGVQLLDISGPLDVFAEANTRLGRQVYRLQVMALDDQPVVSSSGVRLLADLQLQDENLPPVDTFLIAGAPALGSFQPGSEILSAVRHLAQKSVRYGSVCSGALLLDR